MQRRRFRFLFAVLVLSWASWVPAADLLEPITQPKTLYLDTELARVGTPRAVIYHPDSQSYEAAARELADLLETHCGARLTLKVDDARQLWQQEQLNILALGNFGNSRLLRWLRARSFVATQSRSGAPSLSIKRRLRTVHDPWAEGRNVVMLGGIDVEHVRENFAVLLERLQRPAPGTVILPRTLDPCPDIGAELRARIAEKRGNVNDLPLNYPAYYAGWVCKHYPSLGHEGFVELYRDAVKRLSETKSYNHLYLFRECNGWDLVEESPVLTAADRLMITNFFRETIADQAQGIGRLRTILNRGRTVLGNHESQTACGIMVMADYLRRYYPSALHEQWYGDALSFFELYRTKGSYVGDDEVMQGASISNIMDAVRRTCDDLAEHPFLKQVLNRLMPNFNNFGTFPAYGDMTRPSRFGAGFYREGALVYDDPGFLWMSHFIRTAEPTRALDVPAELEGPSWEPAQFAPRCPEGFVGLQWAEPDDILYSMARPKWREENDIKLDDCFGRCAFRAGVSPRDDYLLLDGVHLNHAYDDQNGILEFSTLGRTFLVSLDYAYGTKLSAHNVVALSVDGVADCLPARLAVRRLWADLPLFAATRTLLYTDGRADWQKLYCPSADWERNILWLKNRFFVVFDRVIAKREGLHSAVAFWRMLGARHDVPDGIEMRQQGPEGEVAFTLLAQDVDRVELGREEDPQAPYLFTRYNEQLPPPLDNVPPVVHMLKAHKARRLAPGGSFTLTAAFWATSAARPAALRCTSLASGALRLHVDGQPMLAALGPFAAPALDIEAELSLVSEASIDLVHGRRLVVGSETVFQASAPLTLEWDLVSGVCTMQAEQETVATFGAQALELEPGRSVQRLEPGSVRAALKAALTGLTPLPPEQPMSHVAPASAALDAVATFSAASAVRCLWTGKLAETGVSVVAGLGDGAVVGLQGETLKPVWTYRCDRVVNSIDAGDLDGDGALDVVIGSDDHHVHALDARGQLLWKWQPPFDWEKAKIAYCQWLWPEPFVKKVAVHDLDADGKAEVLVGGGMNTFALNGKGEQIWAFRESKGHCPSMQAVAFADVDGDGAEDPIFGASDMWYVSCMWAVDAKGAQLQQFASDGWCSGARVALAADLAGNGLKSLVYGTRLGGIWCYPDPRDLNRKWYRRFADQVDCLALLKRKEGSRLIACAGGDTKWVTVLDADGNTAWAQYMDAPVAALACDAAQQSLYVGTDAGAVHQLSPTGAPMKVGTLTARPTALAPALGGGVVAGTDAGSVLLLR